MCKKRYASLIFRILIVAILLFIIVSRAVGLTYNLSIHPDDSEFYIAAGSLAQSLLDPSVPFVEEKEYPEGGYLLQLPFQLLKEAVDSSNWFWHSSQCWNRISSLFYFVLATIYGIMLLTKYMSKSRLAALIYALTMCFSLFFIEHSRYGVGDMGSLWLLMTIIYHSARALETRKKGHLAVAFFLAGVMGAVKYPQLFFVLIPTVTYWHMNDNRRAKKAAAVAVCLLITTVAFLMFSPKAVQDLGYFRRVISREGDAYLGEGTGGVLEHFARMVVYTLLYSDFPLSFLLVAVSFGESITNKTYIGETDYLFRKLLPIVIAIFFTYNLFASFLVFRTLTPFFGLTALYSAEIAGRWCQCSDTKLRKTGRILILLMTCLMVFRGTWLLKITGHQGDEKDRFTSLITAVVDDNWNQVTLLEPYNVATKYSFADYLKCPEDLTINKIRLGPYAAENNGVTLQPGELVITGAYEHSMAAPYLFPCKDSDETKLWRAFQQENQDYYVGQIYPDACYYLFGGWIRSGTLSQFLIPCNTVYYRSA